LRHLYEALIVLDTDLRAMGVRWALIGGLAVSARSEPRTTRDLDLALAVQGDREAETVVRALTGRGYRINTVMDHRTVDRLSTVRVDMRGEDFEGVVADLLFGSSGIEPEVIAEAQRLEVLPLTYMPVARTGHLLALKVLSASPDRLQDYTDLKELLKVADERELLRARQAVDLISRRGFDRGKDLLGRLEALIRDGYLSPDHA
jgi:hypothetical protein